MALIISDFLSKIRKRSRERVIDSICFTGTNIEIEFDKNKNQTSAIQQRFEYGFNLLFTNIAKYL